MSSVTTNAGTSTERVVGSRPSRARPQAARSSRQQRSAARSFSAAFTFEEDRASARGPPRRLSPRGRSCPASCRGRAARRLIEDALADGRHRNERERRRKRHDDGVGRNALRADRAPHDLKHRRDLHERRDAHEDERQERDERQRDDERDRLAQQIVRAHRIGTQQPGPRGRRRPRRRSSGRQRPSRMPSAPRAALRPETPLAERPVSCHSSARRSRLVSTRARTSEKAAGLATFVFGGHLTRRASHRAS